MMRNRIAWLVGAASVLVANAATAQPLPCSSVSPEVRDYVRQRGACRESRPAPRTKAAVPSKSQATARPTAGQQRLVVPDVVNRGAANLDRLLASFTIERISTRSATPAGTVLAQEPAPGAEARSGSKIVLIVSDGSGAAASAGAARPAADPAAVAPHSSAAAPASPVPAATPVAAPSAAPSAAPVAATAASAASASPAQSGVAAEPTPRHQDALLTNAAVIFGAGAGLGLLAGVMLMRARLRRREPAEPPSNGPPLRSTPVGLQSHEQEPAAQQPQAPDSSASPTAHAPAAATKIEFAARLVPLGTSITLAPPRDADVAVALSSGEDD
jgi:hypothetical protein